MHRLTPYSELGQGTADRLARTECRHQNPSAARYIAASALGAIDDLFAVVAFAAGAVGLSAVVVVADPIHLHADSESDYQAFALHH